MPPPAPRRRPVKTYLRAAAAVVVVIFMAVGWWASRDDAETAAVGDCLKSASSSSDRMEVVDCSSSEAQSKVIKKIDGHFTQFTAETECRKVEGATGFYAETGKGDEFLLCTKDA
ncbi:LppU/SCO3897 family protein [Streptomyces flavofungini]|uniref:LppU/SCO3897 family protein n=1 Tax=Streptomyces flavofungini TaxID=68200 RepID=UPI0034DF794D